MQQIKEYEVNSSTMFLTPVDYGSKIFTRIIEVEDEFLTPLKPIEVIKRSCDYYGVDYESRKKGTKLLIGYNRKIPIVIEPTNRIFFFPTTSPNSPECIWISFEHLHFKKCRRVGPHQTLISFWNKQSHLFPVSYGTIETQCVRTALLKTELLQRIERNKRVFYMSYVPKSSKASETTRKYGDEIFLDKKK